MGKNPSHPLAPRRVNPFKRRDPTTVTRRGVSERPISLVFLFAIFAYFAVNSYGQDLTTLETTIRTGTTEQKRDALFQIRDIRSEIASRAAVPALKDSDPIIRATAASSVTFLPKPEAVAALAPLLADKDAFVRKEAAYALGNTQSREAAAPLLELFRREKDLEVKSAIVVALGQTGNVSAVEPLTALFKRSPKEEEEFIRRSAARSIGQIAQINKTGKERVVTPQSFLPEAFKDLTGDDLTSRFPAFTAAVVILSSVLQNTREADDTRRESAFALGAIGSRNSIAILENHRNSPDPYLAEIAREALAKIAKTVTVN